MPGAAAAVQGVKQPYLGVVARPVPLTLLRGGRERVVEAVLEEHEVPTGEPNREEMIWGADGLDPREQAELERTLAERWARWSRAGLGGVVPPGFAPGTMPRGGHAKAWVTAGPNTLSMTVVSDARGTAEIRGQGDKRTLTLTDADGEEVYSGPLDSEEDFARVPEEYREWVREVAPRQSADREVAPKAKDSASDTE